MLPIKLLSFSFQDKIVSEKVNNSKSHDYIMKAVKTLHAHIHFFFTHKVTINSKEDVIAVHFGIQSLSQCKDSTLGVAYTQIPRKFHIRAIR
jgi:hypothetical protein